MKSSFFIGYREANEENFAELRASVEQHIVEFGVMEFIVEYYGDFDRLAAGAILEVKKMHLEVTLTLLILYYPTERPLVAPDIKHVLPVAIV